MKRLQKRTIVILGVVFIGIIFFISLKGKTSVRAPHRLNKIPNRAEWIGGEDGGVWFYIEKVTSPSRYKIKLYNEQNGDLESDSIFTLHSKCSIKNIDSIDLQRYICGFDGKSILLNLSDSSKCTLIPVN